MVRHRIDLHVHTKYSSDAMIEVEDIPKIARSKGLRGIAITDHNTMRAFEHLPTVEDIWIVRGVEINTDRGHVIGLFVSEAPRATILEEALDEIRGQGGIAIMAHPFGFPRLGYIFRRATIDDLVPLARKFDAVEVCNSRVLFPSQNSAARELALKSERPATGGSDGHFNHEVGRCCTIFENASSEDELYDQLKRGETTAEDELSPLVGHAFSAATKVYRLFVRI